MSGQRCGYSGVTLSKVMSIAAGLATSADMVESDCMIAQLFVGIFENIEIRFFAVENSVGNKADVYTFEIY